MFVSFVPGLRGLTVLCTVWCEGAGTVWLLDLGYMGCGVLLNVAL